MTQKDKELLLKDLSSRLPYKPICHAKEINLDGELYFINIIYSIVALSSDRVVGHFETCPVADIKPYLRPMSSMTEQEKKIARDMIYMSVEFLDWCNKNHFDYRGLIEKGLAIEAPEDMYKED